ncbi:class F sortase [Streptomyces sp. NPDC057445]|uniref:class F sortase n=1 Tax=Streptomyces sp. NPDC057445 TaxID=3346136 RepID=UPI0036B52313
MPSADLPAVRRRITVAALSVLLLTGCSATAHDGPAPAPARPSAPGTPAAGGSPSEQQKPTAPVQVAIPSLGVDSSLMPLGLNSDGTVEVPPADQGMTAGWYTGGAVPGEPGAAVIIGHNDTRFGRAVFHDLRKLARGADIAVRNTRGETVHFTVTAVETVSKKSFPTERVYGATGDRVLRLITCDGAFDAEGHPVDNLIVHATVR